MRTYILIPALTAMLLLASTVPVFAQPSSSVPPSGSSCGAFYGSVASSEAREGHLGGQINPGVLHKGFAGAEEFGEQNPGTFECPS